MMMERLLLKKLMRGYYLRSFPKFKEAKPSKLADEPELTIKPNFLPKISATFSLIS